MTYEHYTVNSDHTLATFTKRVADWYGEHKYITFDKPRIGADRSIDQNALFHVWLTQLAAHFAKCDKTEVTEGMAEGMKRHIKGLCYRDTGWKFMLLKVRCPETGQQKIGYRSSSRYKHHEMFQVLTWIQAHYATEHSIILESKGKFNKKQQEQTE